MRQGPRRGAEFKEGCFWGAQGEGAGLRRDTSRKGETYPMTSQNLGDTRYIHVIGVRNERGKKIGGGRKVVTAPGKI